MDFVQKCISLSLYNYLNYYFAVCCAWTKSKRKQLELPIIRTKNDCKVLANRFRRKYFTLNNNLFCEKNIIKCAFSLFSHSRFRTYRKPNALPGRMRILQQSSRVLHTQTHKRATDLFHLGLILARHSSSLKSCKSTVTSCVESLFFCTRPDSEQNKNSTVMCFPSTEK